MTEAASLDLAVRSRQVQTIFKLLCALPVGDEMKINNIRWRRESTAWFSTPEKLRYDAMAAARATLDGKV